MSNEILSQLGVGVLIIDTSGKVRYANKEIQGVFGIPLENILNKTYRDPSQPWIFGQNHIQNKKFPVLEAMQTGDFVNDTMHLNFNEKDSKYVSCFAGPLRSKSKSIIGAIEISVDSSKSDLSESAKNNIYKSIKAYISKNTWNHIITNARNKNQIPAIKRFVTIGFIDIVGFSSMAEKLDAHETVTMLNIFFNKIYNTITRYKGDVDKFLGDALLATFFNAEAAVRCFTNILLIDLPTINTQIQNYSKDIPELQVHVGLNSGWVILGEVGANSRKEITVIGDDVNTAARIQSLTPPNEIWISSRTVANLGEFSSLLKEADFIKVKGKSQRIKVYKFDPTSIKIDSKVFCYETDKSTQDRIRTTLERKGVRSFKCVDSMDKISSNLTKDYDTMILGPSTSMREISSIKNIIERIGLNSNIILPISRDVSPESVEALDRLGIKTYIPESEGKQFENSLGNVIRTQKINKIPPKISLEEEDYSEKKENKDHIENQNLQTQTAIKQNTKTNEKPKEENENISDAIIYNKENHRIVISIKRVLAYKQLKQLSDNLFTIWEYDYHSKMDINLVFNIDSVMQKEFNQDYVENICKAINQNPKFKDKGWKGSIVFKTNKPELIEYVQSLEEEDSVKVEKI